MKSLERSKSRLAGTLSPVERGALTLAMMEDVLDATLAMSGWESWVVSPDEAILEIAARRGAQPVPEDKPPLSEAIRQVEREARDHDAGALAVLFADVALITPDALSAALHTLGPVVVARSTDDGGTNLLLRRPPRAVAARFGPNSFRRHLEAATARGLPAAIVDLPELGFDLDGPDDILKLLRSGRQGRTRDVCLQMDVMERLRVNA